MKEKIVVGLSGGVDSSVAAYILKEQGYDVIGVTMQVWQDAAGTGLENPEDCSNIVAVSDAKRVAEALDIPFYVFNFKEEFDKHVVQYFANEYLHGRTPNPCNMCNRFVKWEALLNRASELGAQHIATGHYAKIKQLSNGRFVVANSVTAKKDQTYALYNLTQEQLSHTLMPIGAYTKEEIRQIAVDANIPVAAKADSQDICFIPDGDYNAFLKKILGDKMPGAGNFVNKEGKILGTHLGITNYTVGQRKGLNLALGYPVFVSAIRPETNEVVISDTGDVFAQELICNKLNFMAAPDLTEPRTVVAKIRYAHKGTACTIEKIAEDTVRCHFTEEVRAVTPGQAVVFYEDDYVFGGGTIIR